MQQALKSPLKAGKKFGIWNLDTKRLKALN